MEPFFHQLFDYNFFCNKKLIESCSGMKKVPENTLKLFSHILNAHHIWNARLQETDPQLGVWDIHPLGKWEELHYENQRTSFEIISNAASFEKRISYQTTEGQNYANSLQDILFHIVNHSTHHRAQISNDFRAAGLEPLSLDYIIYKR